jgi:DNA-binding XRE family transcriptional regulator
MSQAELGLRVGMPQSQIARIESGRKDLRLSTVIELARILDLEPMLIPKHLVPAVRYMVAPKPPTKAMTPEIVAPRLVGNEPEDATDDR